MEEELIEREDFGSHTYSSSYNSNHNSNNIHSDYGGGINGSGLGDADAEVDAEDQETGEEEDRDPTRSMFATSNDTTNVGAEIAGLVAGVGTGSTNTATNSTTDNMNDVSSANVSDSENHIFASSQTAAASAVLLLSGGEGADEGDDAVAVKQAIAAEALAPAPAETLGGAGAPRDQRAREDEATAAGRSATSSGKAVVSTDAGANMATAGATGATDIDTDDAKPLTCLICGRGETEPCSSGGPPLCRPILRFLPVEHDAASAAAAPSVTTFTEDIALHVFCGKTASILPSVNQPDLEILSKAGLKNKHGIGPEVNAALARTRCAILTQDSDTEKDFYLVREFEAHLAAIRHTTITFSSRHSDPFMELVAHRPHRKHDQIRAPRPAHQLDYPSRILPPPPLPPSHGHQQQDDYYTLPPPSSYPYHPQLRQEYDEEEDEEGGGMYSTHHLLEGDDEDHPHSNTTTRHQQHDPEAAAGGEGHDDDNDDDSSNAIPPPPSQHRAQLQQQQLLEQQRQQEQRQHAKTIPVRAQAGMHHPKHTYSSSPYATSQAHHVAQLLPQHHPSYPLQPEVLLDGRIRCACGGTHMALGTPKGATSWRNHITSKRHQKWMEENGWAV